MFRNRITMSEPEPFQLPPQAVPAFNLSGFVLVAVPAMPGQQMSLQQWLYQRAFETAQAVARPSLLERDLLGVWN